MSYLPGMQIVSANIQGNEFDLVDKTYNKSNPSANVSVITVSGDVVMGVMKYAVSSEDMAEVEVGYSIDGGTVTPAMMSMYPGGGMVEHQVGQWAVPIKDAGAHTIKLHIRLVSGEMVRVHDLSLEVMHVNDATENGIDRAIKRLDSNRADY